MIRTRTASSGRVLLAPLAAVLLVGCGKEAKKDLGSQVGDIASDTAVLRQAQGAVNEVIRNAADCDAAKPAIAEAHRALEEALSKVRTATGRTTLEALRKQVSNVAEACP